MHGSIHHRAVGLPPSLGERDRLTHARHDGSQQEEARCPVDRSHVFDPVNDGQAS